LGQEGFTGLVRYAYDRGIRFFETAESYGDMHRMLGVAVTGIPRDSYRLTSQLYPDGAKERISPATSLRDACAFREQCVVFLLSRFPCLRAFSNTGLSKPWTARVNDLETHAHGI
jgi:aryl-alcohol dehydrogenase-like predicted oxidoreductase